MTSPRRYRVLSLSGTAVLSAVIVYFSLTEIAQSAVSLVPVLGQLPTIESSMSELFLETATAVVVLLAVLFPMYKPRPRRILDITDGVVRRVVFGMAILATVGYFDYTYRLPRLAVLIATPMLLLALPMWFIAIRRRPRTGDSRIAIVGNDPDQIETAVAATDLAVIGYVAPRSTRRELARREAVTSAVTDGGAGVGDQGCLGGLPQFEEVLVECDIDTAVLAFRESDRQEFFGALDVCYDNGVTAKVNREHAETLLTDEMESGALVTVNLEPWDWQDRLLKRLLDVGFAVIGLVVLLPVTLAISAAIKFDDGGSVLYSQERTTMFGDTFTVYKFRSMIENAEDAVGAKLSEEDAGGRDPRVTRVGRVLRQTHLDEIPQLWSILTGQMSVVGPRPERPELDADIRDGVEDWHKRWFVKPGLTGLAQINNVTGHEPAKKLRYDIRYVQEQSFSMDLKIIVRQFTKLLFVLSASDSED